MTYLELRDALIIGVVCLIVGIAGTMLLRPTEDQCFLAWNRFYQENGQRVERLMLKRPGENPTSDLPRAPIAQAIEEGCWGVVELSDADKAAIAKQQADRAAKLVQP